MAKRSLGQLSNFLRYHLCVSAAAKTRFATCNQNQLCQTKVMQTKTQIYQLKEIPYSTMEVIVEYISRKRGEIKPKSKKKKKVRREREPKSSYNESKKQPYRKIRTSTGNQKTTIHYLHYHKNSNYQQILSSIAK